MEKVKLFCLPCAGGSAIMYSKWNRHFCDFIEVIPIELPGRGSRVTEDFCDSFDSLIDDIFMSVKRQILNSKYALLGFSMGGLLAYEVYHRLINSGEHEPLHLFIISREAPKSNTIKISHLNDREFINEVYSYGGIADEIYQNKELIEFHTPRIRADFEIYEKYECDILKPIHTDLSVLYSAEDPSIFKDGILDWKQCTTMGCAFHQLNGGHFFITQQEKHVTSIIQATLKQKIN